jgi:hypothetical protein
MTRGTSLVGLVALAGLAGCGAAGSAPSASPSASTAQATAATPVPTAPPTTAPPTTAPPTTAPAPVPVATDRPPVRLSDGRSVVAVDPATGAERASWPDAAISLDGRWTVAVGADAASGRTDATWIGATGEADRSGPVPAGLRPTVTSADGRWAVLAEPAPARAAGEIGPARTSSHFAVTDGAGWLKQVTLPGNFSPEAFGFIEDHPMTLQMIEYLPPDHPTSYRVRTLDLTTGAVGLPVNLRDKATPVDETMAGTSRTQVYASGEDLLFTLYQPVSTDGGAWEYGFVHTLATAWGGVWCIDLPDVLGLEDHRGTLALSPDHRVLYVATGAGRIGTIHTSDLQALAVDRTANLGVAADEQPVMVAGSDRLWVGLGRRLLVVDPISLEVVARAELPATVTALTLDPMTHELVGADDGGHLRRWALDEAGQLAETASIPLPAGLGPVARIVP